MKKLILIMLLFASISWGQQIVVATDPEAPNYAKTNTSNTFSGSQIINGATTLNGVVRHEITYDDQQGAVGTALSGSAIWTVENYGTNTGITIPFFRHDQNDEATIQFQFSHKRKLQSLLTSVHIHYVGMANVSGNVFIRYRYTWSTDGDVVPIDTANWTKGFATIPILGTDQYKSGTYSIITNMIPPANEGYSSILWVQIIRVAQSSSSDTYSTNKTAGATATANFGIRYLDAHTQVDRLGSKNEYND